MSSVTADVPADVAPPAAPPAINVGAGRSLGWWGMVTLIATEAMVFALLLFSYFYLRAQSSSWPLGGIEKPDLFAPAIRTVLLLGSSIPVHFAERAIKRGDRRRMLGLFAVAWVMAGAFLVGHFVEYADLWDKFRPSTNAYGSLFYSITMLHAVHLIVGMTMVAYVWIRGLRGRYDERRHVAVETTVMYWHFVDAVWIAVFASLYLSVAL